MNRRDFIRTGSFLAAGALSHLPRKSNAADGAKNCEVLETRVISQQPQYYQAWPSLTRRRNGQLLLAYSGGREKHICPFGRVEFMVSSDQGKHWSWPQVILDSAIDDRDAGILETAKGTILVTSFTSLAYESQLETVRNRKPGEPGAWPPERLDKWISAHDRLTKEQRQAELGQWMVRSSDGGLTWSARYPTIVNSPHGPIQLADGRLFYAGKELWAKTKRNGVCESTDDGQTWRWLAEIPTRPGDNPSEYHELHVVETGDRQLVLHIRNENKNNQNETLQTESTDGGKTWSVPHTIGVWGLPSFLLRLRDGRLLMTYGHRRPPFGNQARISQDHGRTWSEPMIISSDGVSGDLGYPSTVEMEDGSLLTVWYEAMKEHTPSVLRQAHWRLPT